MRVDAGMQALGQSVNDLTENEFIGVKKGTSSAAATSAHYRWVVFEMNVVRLQF